MNAADISHVTETVFAKHNIGGALQCHSCGHAPWRKIVAGDQLTRLEFDEFIHHGENCRLTNEEHALFERRIEAAKEELKTRIDETNQSFRCVLTFVLLVIGLLVSFLAGTKFPSATK